MSRILMAVVVAVLAAILASCSSGSVSPPLVSMHPPTSLPAYPAGYASGHTWKASGLSPKILDSGRSGTVAGMCKILAPVYSLAVDPKWVFDGEAWVFGCIAGWISPNSAPQGDIFTKLRGSSR